MKGSLPLRLVPQELKELYLGSSYNKPIKEDVLPSCLEKLTINNDFFRNNEIYPITAGVLPYNINHLVYDPPHFNRSSGRDVLPSGLEVLELGCSSNEPIALDAFLIGLKVLDMGFKSVFVQPFQVGVFPFSLTNLTVYGYNGTIAKGVFREGLQQLDLSDYFNQSLEPGVLPSTLVELKFGENFDQPIVHNVLPSSLRKVQFDNSCNQPLHPNILPEGLEILVLSYSYTHPTPPLSQSLIHLKIGGDYNLPIEVGVLPANLNELIQ
jgi:hypothetical protein